MPNLGYKEELITMNLNLHKVPFSRFGSYIALKQNGINDEIYITTMHGFWEDEMNLFRIIPQKNGVNIEYTIKMLPWLLLIETDYGNIGITLNGSNGILLSGSGVGVKIESVCKSVVNENGGNNSCYLDFWDGRVNTAIHCVDGKLDIDEVATKTEKFKLYIAVSATQTEQLDLPHNFDDFSANVIEQEYKNWIAPLQLECEHYRDTIELASYILWSSTVSPCGNITRNTLLMSKNWMHYVWAWDHCFNAIALANAHPKLAWEQIQVFFDNQMEDGKLPDLIYANDMNLAETKPPIHGWCFEKLLDAGLEIDNNEFHIFYNKLAKWTNWWFENRDEDKDGICQYNLNNESGHDNSTVFDEGLPVESPDLTAFLIMQIKCLRRMAKMLEKHEDEKKWEEMQKNIFDKFFEHSWKDNEFVTLKLDNHKKVESNSIINMIPIVMGELLPTEYFDKLVEKLSVENEFLSPYGLVTESMTSKCFNKHAKNWTNQHEPTTTYWRGAIWAPVIYLVVDGLRRGGEVELAKKIALRFCNMVNGQDGIFENYNSETGVGGCDSSYTWTCSVFLLLIKEFLM